MQVHFEVDGPVGLLFVSSIGKACPNTHVDSSSPFNFGRWSARAVGYHYNEVIEKPASSFATDKARVSDSFPRVTLFFCKERPFQDLNKR